MLGTHLVWGLRKGPQGREGRASSWEHRPTPRMPALTVQPQGASGCPFPMLRSQGCLPHPDPFPGPRPTGLSSFLLAAASRMITNSLNRDSPPGTPPRRPDTSTSKISVTVSNKMAAKSAKAAGEGTQAGGGRSWGRMWVGRRYLGDMFPTLQGALEAKGVQSVQTWSDHCTSVGLTVEGGW